MKYIYYGYKRCLCCGITNYYSYINKNTIYCKRCRYYSSFEYYSIIGNWEWA